MTHATPKSRRARRFRGDHGSSLIEVAIGAPLLFSLMLGTYPGGIALSHQNSMTSAVREGARVGATLSHDDDWADDVRDTVVSLAPGHIKTSQVCVKLVKAPDIDLRETTCTGELTATQPSLAEVPAGDCVVVVWAAREDKLEAVFVSRDLDLTASSISRYERDCA